MPATSEEEEGAVDSSAEDSRPATAERRIESGKAQPSVVRGGVSRQAQPGRSNQLRGRRLHRRKVGRGRSREAVTREIRLGAGAT